MAIDLERHAVIIFIISMVTVDHVTGIDQSCPAPIPCLCEGYVIDCRYHHLTNLPAFSYGRGAHTILMLGFNNLAAVPSSAFSVLNVSEIHLNYNIISSIDSGAFRGMERTLRVLNLAHNRLQTLPGALDTLTVLSNLDVSYNPIDGYRTSAPHRHTDDFTEAVMTSLGDSLTSFTFGDDFMIHWPNTLHHLNQLQELNVAGSSIQFLVKQSFHGFEVTLRKLTISHGSFSQMPLDIGALTHLEELHFDHNRALDGDSVILPQPLIAVSGTLKVLSLRYDNLTVVPTVLKEMGNLQNISLDGNPFEFISQESIGFLQRTRVNILSFKDCGLKRIPGSLSDLPNLLKLDFSNNNIRSIESVDLRNIPTLQALVLAYNPLKFISRDSFIGLTSLATLDMSHTEVTVIPESVANLDSLQTLDFTESNIDCTCDLSWVRRLMEYIQIDIIGDCETIHSKILDYIMKRVPECLDYKNYAIG